MPVDIEEGVLWPFVVVRGTEDGTIELLDTEDAWDGEELAVAVLMDVGNDPLVVDPVVAEADAELPLDVVVS